MEDKIIILPEANLKALQSQLDRIEHQQSRLLSDAQREILYTDEEFCEIVKCSKKTAQNWRNRGFIQFVQLGSVIRYPKAAVLEFVEKFSIKTK